MICLEKNIICEKKGWYLSMEKYNKFLVILIVVIVLAMSIGYSVLNSELSISGEVNYRPQSDVRVTSFTTSNKPTAMAIEYSDFSKHQVKLGYTTTAPCSITYTVKVGNYSGVGMELVSVDGLNDNVEIQEGIIGQMIVDSAKEKTFTITFKSTQAETKAYLLTFEFAQNYTVTYSELGNTDGYIKEVLKGGRLEQNLGTTTEVCSVTMGGRSISNYTFSDGTIIISSVTGDVVINGYIPVVEEPTTPNPPELMEGMIAVYYDSVAEEWKKANVSNANNSWYNYTNQQWANAVTVVASGTQTRSYYKNATVGTIIPMSDINTLWVWIPRYSYTIKSEDEGTNYFGKKTSCTTPTRALPGEIDVKFIPKTMETEMGSAQYIGDTASGWRTNEAFNFGGEKRGGIWVAKFEPTGSLLSNKQACTDTNCDVSNVTVKPGLSSLRNQTVSSFFFMSRSMQLNNANPYGFNASSGDLHMMKNDEWGAVAYLSQSMYGKYGNSDYTKDNKEVYINNDSYITGKSGGSSDAKTSVTKYAYNDMTNLGTGRGQAGPGASTTGNITGIYDMSGGAYEYVMSGVEYDAQGVTEHNGQIVAGYSSNRSSGFKGLDKDGKEIGSYDLPNEKYYNKYKTVSPTSYGFTSAKAESACNGGVCYGHALSETGASSGWYGDYALFIGRTSSWFNRGGSYVTTTGAGMFAANYETGEEGNSYSCRLVFTP